MLARRVYVVGLLVIASAIALPACLTTSGASPHAMPAVRLQASTDLDCPQNELRITQELGGRFAVVGCGHKAVYNTACEALRCTAAPLGQVVPWRARPDPSPTTP